MNPREATAYLGSLTNYECTPQPEAMQTLQLDRMRILCEHLGNPQHRFRSVLVAGTNGKGSICAMLYEILRAAGLRVGLYTSPHLIDVRERIRVHPPGEVRRGAPRDGDDWISQGDFCTQLSRVREASAGILDRQMSPPPTFFEVLTAAAFQHFCERKVHIAVLEVGLGGRLDATNLVNQAVTVLGPIDYDHTNVLGEDLVGIAREKMGVLKPLRAGARPRRVGHPVISARQSEAVMEHVRTVTTERGDRLIEFGRQIDADVQTHERSGLRLGVRGVRGKHDDLRLSMVGRRQAENAALAVAAIEALSDSGVPHGAIRTGLSRVRWPGRCDVIQEEPGVVFDGAHNPQAIRCLKETLEELWPGCRIHLVVGMSADKPVQPVVTWLGPMASAITCTASRHPRAQDPSRLAEALRVCDRPLSVLPDAVDAYTYALNRVGHEELVVVTGSLFLVGELLARIRSRQAACRRPRVHQRATSPVAVRLASDTLP